MLLRAGMFHSIDNVPGHAPDTGSETLFSSAPHPLFHSAAVPAASVGMSFVVVSGVVRALVTFVTLGQ
ncbi:MAG TPA: hypothetical protein VM163_04510 [bacterium]|nr:hypothetical protein [bacterium]